MLSKLICFMLFALGFINCVRGVDLDCNIVLCSSNNFEPDQCGVGYEIFSITLHNTVSAAPCVQNDSWSYNSTFIFVNQGCRAEFNVCREAQPDNCASVPCQNGGNCTSTATGFTCDCAEGWTGQTCDTAIVGETTCECIVCQSFDFELDNCTASFDIDTITIKQQLSVTDCVENVNYWTQGDLIVVDHGCRADFNVCKVVECKEKCKQVTCESVNFQEKICNTGVAITSLTANPQLSSAPCTPDVSFFIQGMEIKVVDGCRADFDVCYQECL